MANVGDLRVVIVPGGVSAVRRSLLEQLGEADWLVP
jgi:hypothetical protein